MGDQKRRRGFNDTFPSILNEITSVATISNLCPDFILSIEEITGRSEVKEIDTVIFSC